MIFFARCPNRRTLGLRTEKKKGDIVACSKCSQSIKRIACPRDARFVLMKDCEVWKEENSFPHAFVGYSEEENDAKTSEIASDSLAESIAPIGRDAAVQAERNTRDRGEGASFRRVGGKIGCSRQRQEGPMPAQKATELLQASGSYKEINIGGKIYSDDATVQRKSGSLRDALKDILIHWNTTAVFSKSKDELKDEFIWLLASTAKHPIKSETIRSILEKEYTLSQKFFYIFYGVVYKDVSTKELAELGFFWYDGQISFSPLSPYFYDKSDFIEKYCHTGDSGVMFRNFYRERRAEVLHFLRIEIEESFFEDVTLIFAKEKCKLVLIDKTHDYLPIQLGKVDDFVRRMKEPVEISDMYDMVAFLEKYRIIPPRQVVVREVPYTFQKSGKGGLQEDQSMYDAFSLQASSSYATEYDLRVTLLREYVSAFSPPKVQVGCLRFTSANFSNELEEIVFDFCKVRFGNVEDAVFEEKKGRAWLAKSIYEREILCTFPCENKERINKLMSLVAEVDNEKALEKYFSLFSVPLLRKDSRDCTMHDYIMDCFAHSDVDAFCSEFENDKVISYFVRAKVAQPEELTKGMIEASSKYQELYDRFLK